MTRTRAYDRPPRRSGVGLPIQSRTDGQISNENVLPECKLPSRLVDALAGKNRSGLQQTYYRARAGDFPRLAQSNRLVQIHPGDRSRLVDIAGLPGIVRAASQKQVIL